MKLSMIKQLMLRGILFPVTAAAVTLLLFILMVILITIERPDFNQVDELSGMNFIRMKPQQDAPEVRKREIKRKDPPKPPPRPTMNLSAKQAPTPKQMPQMNMPAMNSLLDMNFGSMLGGIKVNRGGGVSAGDQSLIPLVRIPPRYPMQASLDGIEGWVKLSFTITETGSVKGVQIIDAKPKRIFNRAAKRALLKWRFKPMVVNGNPVARQAVQTLEFKLQN